MLPDGSGFDLLRELRTDGRTPVIMLTARGDESDRVLGLELGADDYVVKPFSARELVARIRAVLRRTSAARRPDRARPAADRRPRARRLRAHREARRRAARAHAQGVRPPRAADGPRGHACVSRERLIDEVWDVNWFGSTKTLDVHVSGLRKKLGDDSSDPRYLHTVRGVGFRFARLRRSPMRHEPAAAPRPRLRLRAPVRDHRARGPADPELLAPRRQRDQGRGERRRAGGRRGGLGPADRRPRAGGARARPGADASAGACSSSTRAAACSSTPTAPPRAAPPTPAVRRSPRRCAAPAQGTRHSDSLDADLLYTAVPVVDAGRAAGAVRLTQSVKARPRRGPPRRRSRCSALGGAVLALGLGLAWAIAGSLSRPLRGLADTARRIAAGDLQARARRRGSTEQVEVANAFNDMTERLVRALDAQRDFVANASHQLRTPLTGLRLRLESASLRADDPDLQRDLVAGELEAERLAKLLSNLLRLAQEGQPATTATSIALADVAERAAERWRDQAERDGHAIELAGAAARRTCTPRPATSTP